LATLALLSACGGDNGGLYVIDSEILVTPAIADVGDVPVGQPLVFTLQIDHIAGADVNLRGVDVFNVAGDGFSFVGDLPLIPHYGTTTVELVYDPPEGGYDRAVATIISDAIANPQITVEVRGHGVQAALDRWPSVLDFGAVGSGRTVLEAVSVFNDSGVDVTLADATATGAGFAVDEAFPMVVAAHQTVSVDVRYSAADTLSSEGELVFDFGGAGALSAVPLRANACTTGAAALYDVDGDGWATCAGDCDDGDAGVHPGHPERIDNVDEDCNGLVDDGTVAYDDDGDGFAERDGDCNDHNASISPARAEIIGDGIDNDCDGVADVGSDDRDGDGVAAGAGDCNDSDGAIHPGADELADGRDNDCDGVVDEGTVLYDDDGDGYCESTVTPCSDGAGLRDCDDSVQDLNGDGHLDGTATSPRAVELPDGRDNDCDGAVDEGTNRGDDDGDGFTELGGDCDDTNPDVNPGHFEVRGNGVDDDCDAATLD